MGVNKKKMFGSGTSVGGANLFIDGVSSTITDATDLATFFDFVVGDVHDFMIDGDDIEARITDTDYEVLNNAFDTNTDITSIIETAGYLTVLQQGSFDSASNLVFVSLAGCLTVNQECFFLCSSLHVKDIFLPECTNISGSAAMREMNASLGETLNLPKVTSISAVNGFRFFGYTINAPELTSLQQLDVMAFATGTLFAPKCTLIGLTTGDNSIFRLSNASLILTVNIFLETADGGSPDGDLVYVTDTQGGTVIYVDLAESPDDIIDLAADTIYIDGVKVDWTAPGSVNEISHYEVYVDGNLVGQTTSLFYVVVDLAPSSSDAITVKTIDIAFNNGDSNSITPTINGSITWYKDTLISYYRFDNDVTDEQGANDGTPTSIIYTTGKSGQAIVGNGSTSKVDIGNDIAFQNSKISFSLLFKTAAAGSGFRSLITKPSAFFMGMIDDDFSIYDFDAATARSSGFDFTDDTWRHLVVTMELGVINGVRCYMNGNLFFTTTASIVNQSSPVNIIANTTIQEFTGDVDGLGIWDFILEEEHVGIIESIQNGGSELL